MRPIRYGSVCSGIEAATVAWHLLGWRPAWFAEIDPFPSAVLAHRFPGVENKGDFTRIHADASAGPIDLLVGGTPCQSFSVAGLRRGLDDPRGNLALEFLRLADALRPDWLVWENVPGVLSSNGGRDFGSFLGALGQLGYGWAYRVLDAQFFGVPQRRRRVFVVGHLGDWRRAVAVLFERHCLSRHPPPGREAGPGVAPGITPGARRASGQRFRGSTPAPNRGSGVASDCDGVRGIRRVSGADGLNSPTPPLTTRPWSDRDCQHDRLVAYGGNNTAGPIDVATACNAHGGAHGRLDFESETFVAHTLRADGFDASEDGTGRGTPLVPVAFAELGEGHATYRETDTITGLRTDAGGGSKMANLIAFNATGVKPSPGETTPTLRGGSHANAGHVAAVAYQCHGTNVGPMGTLKEGDGNVTSGVPFVVNAAESCAKRDHARPSDVARCLDGTGGFASSQGGTVVTQPYNIVGLAQQGRNHAYPAEISGCLQGKGLAATGNEAGTLVQSSMAVRRLTPRECERLQGFPDDWTFIPVKPIRKPTPRVLAKWRALGRLGLLDGEPWIMSADGPRYKAIGNSMAVPVMAWIGRRIEMVRSLVATADAGEGGR